MSEQTPVPAEQILLTWKAPVHPHFERSTRWYVIAGIVVLAIAAYGVLSGGWTIALVALLCAGMYFLVRNHKLPDTTIVFTEQGIQLGKKSLPWQEAKGFWLIYTPGYNELHIESANPRTPPLMIQTGSMDVMAIRQFLSARMPEFTDKKESLLDTFIRICKL